MGEATKIQWTGDTFNPWRGCTKVHEGCKFCYAEREAKRFPNIRGKWGPNGTRVVAAEDMWRKPLKWNREAQKAGERRKVFCSSLADVFEDWGGPMMDTKGQVWIKPPSDLESHHANWQLADPDDMQRDPQGWRLVTMHDVRRRLFALIDSTPWLDWQLLTKRPENVRHFWLPLQRCRECGSDQIAPRWIDGVADSHCPDCGACDSFCFRPNVWIGTSISDQETADKYVPELLKLRDLTPCLFLSCEPLVGPVDLIWRFVHQHPYYCPSCRQWSEYPAAMEHCGNCGHEADHDFNEPCPQCGQSGHGELICPRCDTDGGSHGLDCSEVWEETILSQHGLGVDWVIVGGESGPGARPCDVAWIRSLVRGCKSADVAVFVKQLGSQPVYKHGELHTEIDGTDEGFQQRRPSHPKGGDPDEWPEDLRVREFPQLSRTA